MTDMKINFCGVEFKNPIVTASGTFGFGMEYNEFAPLAEYGGIGAKGLTRVPRAGNPPPRIAETPSGILNSIGLQNPGVEYFAEHIMPILAEYDTNVIVNISGNTVEEYCEMAEIISATRRTCVRHGRKRGKLAHKRGQKTLHKAARRKAVAECNIDYGDCESCRGRRRGRTVAYKHAARHED